MEEVLSLMHWRLSDREGRAASGEEFHWGFIDSEEATESWPVSAGKWIISSLLFPAMLRLPAGMRIAGFIPAFEKPRKAAAAINAVLEGWTVRPPDVSGDKRVISDFFPFLPLVPDQGNPRSPGMKQTGQFDEDTVAGPRLSERELAIVELLRDGESNKAIAAALGISESTVKFHLHSIFEKLGAQNRAQAVYRAIRKGMIVL